MDPANLTKMVSLNSKTDKFLVTSSSLLLAAFMVVLMDSLLDWLPLPIHHDNRKQPPTSSPFSNSSYLISLPIQIKSFLLPPTCFSTTSIESSDSFRSHRTNLHRAFTKPANIEKSSVSIKNRETPNPQTPPPPPNSPKYPSHFGPASSRYLAVSALHH